MYSNGNGHKTISGRSREEQWACGLGWFSIGLGLAQIVAPRTISRVAGVPCRSGLMRLVGLREIVTGVGILTRPRPTGWLWGRVGGDAVDLALLGAAMTSPLASRGKLAATTAAVAGVAAVDVACSKLFQGNPNATVGVMRFKKSVAVNKPVEEVYRFWRNLENLPRIMPHVESVRDLGGNRSHWVVKAPVGGSVEWDAEITRDQPNEIIAWRSLEGAEVENSGTVRFERATGGRGTIVRVELQYHPPGGALGNTVATLMAQNPEKQVKVDLMRFRQLMETGVIPTTEGQPAGRARSTSLKFDAPVHA